MIGACIFIIDRDAFSLKDKKSYLFPEQVYEDLYGYRMAAKKKNKELSNFKVDYVLSDAKGNSYWLAEEFYITYHYTSNGGMYTVEHYDDILILKFNDQDELQWGRSVFKRAFKPSYNVFLKENELHLILNSGKKLSKKEDGRTKTSKTWLQSSALYDFVYSESGEVSYDKIQDNKGNYYYRPNYGAFYDDKFIMLSSIGLKTRFMILK